MDFDSSPCRSPMANRPEFTHPRPIRVLRPAEVIARTTLSPSQLRRLMQQGRFPRYIALSPGLRGLHEHVLDAFLYQRMCARSDLRPLGFRDPLPRWSFHISDVPPIRGIRLMRRREVLDLVPMGRGTMYALIPRGLFPQQVSLGPHAARWVHHEVERWLVGREPPAGGGPPNAELLQPGSDPEVDSPQLFL